MRKEFGIVLVAAIASVASATPPPNGGTTTTGSGPQASARPPRKPVQPAAQAPSSSRAMATDQSAKRRGTKPR